MSLITHLKDLPEFQRVTSKKDRLVVIDFHATWCGPCHAIAPKFEAMSQQYRGVTFCKVDVDAAADIAKVQSIRAMPTFQFFKDGVKVDEIKGANAGAIEASIRKHMPGGATSSPAFAGQGHRLDGSPATGDSGAGGTEYGYVKVLLLVAVLWLWYSYGTTD